MIRKPLSGKYAKLQKYIIFQVLVYHQFGDQCRPLELNKEKAFMSNHLIFN